MQLGRGHRAAAGESTARGLRWLRRHRPLWRMVAGGALIAVCFVLALYVVADLGHGTLQVRAGGNGAEGLAAGGTIGLSHNAPPVSRIILVFLLKLLALALGATAGGAIIAGAVWDVAALRRGERNGAADGETPA